MAPDGDARTFRRMVPKRMGGHEIALSPMFRAQTARCRAYWAGADSYNRLDVTMGRRDWQALRDLELAAEDHVDATLPVDVDADMHSYVHFDEDSDQARVRLKVTARTNIYDAQGQAVEELPPKGTPMDVRVLVECNKLWLREGRYGLELMLQQVKFYPRATSQPTAHTSASGLDFLPDPAAPQQRPSLQFLPDP